MSKREEIYEQRGNLTLAQPDGSNTDVSGKNPTQINQYDVDAGFDMLEQHSVEVARKTAPFGLGGLHARRASASVAKMRDRHYADAGWGNHQREGTEELAQRMDAICNGRNAQSMNGISDAYLGLADRLREKGVDGPEKTETAARTMEFHAEAFNQHGIKERVRSIIAFKGMDGLLNATPDMNTPKAVGLIKKSNIGHYLERYESVAKTRAIRARQEEAMSPEFWTDKAPGLTDADYAERVTLVRTAAVDLRAGRGAGIRRDDVKALAMNKMVRKAEAEGISSKTGLALDGILIEQTGIEQDKTKSAKMRRTVAAMSVGIEERVGTRARTSGETPRGDDQQI